jgi:hypothetical protein
VASFFESGEAATAVPHARLWALAGCSYQSSALRALARYPRGHAQAHPRRWRSKKQIR